MLTTEILNHVGFEKILIKYQKALQYLENWKIKIPKDSRLFNYEQSIKYLAAKGIGENPSHLCDLMFDLIEIDEISDIILNENNILSDNEIIIKLTDMVKGLQIKNIDEDPQARSSQFELYVRALLNMSGLDCYFNPTQPIKTPDLTVKFGDKDFDLEVKRPLSAKNLLRNTFKKACSQLDAKNPGILILSLDHVLLGGNNVIALEEGDSMEHSLKLLEKETTKWLDKNKKSLMQRFKSEESVCALLLIVKVPVFIGHLDKMMFANHLRQINLKGFSKDNSKYVESISKHLDKVWANKNQDLN